MDEASVFDVKLAGLEKIMEQGFRDINRRLDELCNGMVGLDKFNDLKRRVERNEDILLEMDKRLDNSERINFVLGILGGLAITVIGAVLVGFATGKIGLVF
jgi:hypothetical protein